MGMMMRRATVTGAEGRRVRQLRLEDWRAT
jgi:hypothetical protein